jgi:hypothetical protein
MFKLSNGFGLAGSNPAAIVIVQRFTFFFLLRILFMFSISHLKKKISPFCSRKFCGFILRRIVCVMAVMVRALRPLPAISRLTVLYSMTA